MRLNSRVGTVIRIAAIGGIVGIGAALWRGDRGTAWAFNRAPEPDQQDRYDFRNTDAYRALAEADRQKLEQVHRDFVLLWGALEVYCDSHNDEPPDSLDALTPLILRELPKDPFVTTEVAERAARDEDAVNRVSRDGWGYAYRKGSPGNRAWILSSIGLKGFPYLAERGNVDLYICKGEWISGINPMIVK